MAWIGGALAWTMAAAAATAIAVVFAATAVVIVLMSSIFLGMAAVALRARRTARAGVRGSDANILEARHVGGHSWVAYRWDERR
jgi:hypothetical protein